MSPTHIPHRSACARAAGHWPPDRRRREPWLRGYPLDRSRPPPLLAAPSEILVRKLESRVEALHEFHDLDRLGEVREKSRFEALFDIARHRVRAQGEHGDV